MQHLEVSSAVRHIYVIRQLRVNHFYIKMKQNHKTAQKWLV